MDLVLDLFKKYNGTCELYHTEDLETLVPGKVTTGCEVIQLDQGVSVSPPGPQIEETNYLENTRKRKAPSLDVNMGKNPDIIPMTNALPSSIGTNEMPSTAFQEKSTPTARLDPPDVDIPKSEDSTSTKNATYEQQYSFPFYGTRIPSLSHVNWPPLILNDGSSAHPMYSHLPNEASSANNPFTENVDYGLNVPFLARMVTPLGNFPNAMIPDIPLWKRVPSASSTGSFGSPFFHGQSPLQVPPQPSEIIGSEFVEGTSSVNTTKLHRPPSIALNINPAGNVDSSALAPSK